MRGYNKMGRRVVWHGLNAIGLQYYTEANYFEQIDEFQEIWASIDHVCEYSYLRKECTQWFTLAPWRTVVSWKLGSSANEGIRPISQTTTITRVGHCPYPEPDLLPTDILKVNFNIILSSMPTSSKWTLSFTFPHKTPIWNSPPPLSATRPTPTNSPT